jgi:nicotinamidase-related amidase
VTHQRVGGFHGSDLDEVLRGLEAATLVFLGVATNASVEGTARAASDLGYRVLIVSDACSAATPEAHAASLESLGLLAEIATTDDLIYALAAQPADVPS